MIAALLALILLAASLPASAQGAGAPPVAAPVTSPAAQADAGAAAKPEPTAQELLAGTLAKDISTASYYELVSWCDQLGLDDSGSRKDLQARLAKHFSVTLPDAPTPGKRTITVKSARQSEYFTQSDSGEKYVLLRGDVEVEVRDLSDGTLQVIKAASITFNQTRRTMSAVGDVTYMLTRQGQTDTFTGQSLDFNLDSSEAVFYDGRTRRTVKRLDKDITYTFGGETITRVSTDTVILQNGAFTSSETPDDPLYQIHSGTVWLLAPGEWAVQDAVLLIGRVPILYLPGFFWPGDDFFFNPNIGYKAREGSFLQTTTYLIGRKLQQESPFSFLQLSGPGDVGYELEPHGMFLRKVPGTVPAKTDGHSLKLMLDAYSRLGAMAGLAGDFSPLGTFRTSIGVSRSIFLDPSSQLYTPYLPQSNPPDTAGDEFWNSSSLFGLSVPFRYGMEGTFKAGDTVASVTAGFQYFSDPFFTTDFYTRTESGVFSALFAQPGTTAAAPPQLANLTWDVTSKVDFTKMVNQPFIQNLSMQNLNVKMTWQSTTASGLSDPDASDPGRSFYYPSSFTAPNVSFSMSGDIVNIGGSSTPAPPTSTTPAVPPGTTPAAPAAAPPPGAPAAPGPGGVPAAGAPVSSAGAAAASAPAEPGKGMRPPVPGGTSAAAPKEAVVRIPFRTPDSIADEPVQGAGQNATFRLSYQLQPRANLEHTFDTTGWAKSEDVNYAILYRTFETGGTSSVTAAASFLDRLADTSITFSADGLWRSRFDPSSPRPSNWTSLRTADLQQDRLTFRSAFQGTVRPFPAVPELSTSNAQYRINLRMYQLGLEGDPNNPTVTRVGPAWTPEAISEHVIATTLAYVTPATSDALAVTFQLPPLIETMTARLDAAAGPLKGRIQGGYSSPPSGFQYQPLIVNASVDTGVSTPGGSPALPGSSLTASEEMQFDLGGSRLTRSTSQIGYSGAAAMFVAQNEGNGLQPATAKVGYDSIWDPIYSWKDRIKITPGLKTHWYLNFKNDVDNLFDFSPALTLTIYKNLDLTFSSVSNDTRTYLWIPPSIRPGVWSDQPWVNPLDDLLRSFNFGNNDDRRRSGFKIQTFSLKAIQHFPDWDVSVEYQGSPQLITKTSATGLQTVQTEWTPTFSIQVQWNSVAEVKSNIHLDAGAATDVPSFR